MNVPSLEPQGNVITGFLKGEYTLRFKREPSNNFSEFSDEERTCICMYFVSGDMNLLNLMLLCLTAIKIYCMYFIILGNIVF